MATSRVIWNVERYNVRLHAGERIEIQCGCAAFSDPLLPLFRKPLQILADANVARRHLKGKSVAAVGKVTRVLGWADTAWPKRASPRKALRAGHFVHHDYPQDLSGNIGCPTADVKVL